MSSNLSKHLKQRAIYPGNADLRLPESRAGKKFEHLEPKANFVILGILISPNRILELLDVRVFVDTPDDLRLSASATFRTRARSNRLSRVFSPPFVRCATIRSGRPKRCTPTSSFPERANTDIGIDFYLHEIREEVGKQLKNRKKIIRRKNERVI